MPGSHEYYFAVVPPGLEEISCAELQSLGFADAGAVAGGVEFSGTITDLYRANLWSRTASRFLLRLAEFPARDFPTLYRKMVKQPWGRFIKPGTPCDVRVSSRQSRLIHRGRIAETTRKAICRALGTQEEAAGPAQKIFLRLQDDRCQISIDSSGELLHRRGYRTARVAAPLRENLAAACLLSLGYEGSQPLVDAMTGSGTFAIEAAMIALNRAPGLKRDFSFMHWPGFRHGRWRQMLDEARSDQKADLSGPILAVDSNPKAIAAATENLQTAGLAAAVEFRCQRFQELVTVANSGLILCNPPYGARLGKNAALQALYGDLGRMFNGPFAAWRGAIVCPDNVLLRRTNLDFLAPVDFSNGGLRVSLREKVPLGRSNGKFP